MNGRPGTTEVLERHRFDEAVVASYMDKQNDSAAGLYKIADCVRMAFHPCAIGDPRGRFLIRARSQTCDNGSRKLSRPV